MRTLIAVTMATALAGCAATLDPNYAMQVDAYSQTVRAQQAVALAYVQAEAARYDAMRAIALTGDRDSRAMAMLALALGGHGGGGAPAGVTAATVPAVPESQDSRALKWAALFAAPVATLAQGYFGYRLGVAQSSNATQSTIASYNALSNVAGAGFGASASIAGAGFGAVSDLFQALPLIPPSITLNGTGVIGSGRYVGPNSGANSGNSGTLGNGNRNDSPDRNCSGATGDGGTFTPSC